MKILILGGSGFFGKSIVDYFQRVVFPSNKDYKLILASRNIQSIHDEISYKYLNSHIYLENIDVTTCKKIPNADLVIHAANTTSEEEYNTNPLTNKEIIIQGTKNIMKLLHRNTSFMYISSGSVYGIQENINIKFPEESSLNTKQHNGPKKIYSESKVIAENIVREYSKKNNLKSTIARCFAFIGKHTPREKHFVIGNVLNAIENNKQLIISSKKPIYRSFMFADDLVSSLLFINKFSNSLSETFNIGSDEYYEIHELVKTLNQEYKIDIKDSNTADYSEKADIYLPNIQKLLSHGFKASYNLKSAMKNIIN